MKRIIVCFISSLLSLLGFQTGLVWGASTMQPWGPTNEIEAAGRREGKLVFYVGAGYTTADGERAISKLFKERYGIGIDWTSLAGSREVTLRVSAEVRTGQRVADLVITGLTGGYLFFKERDLIEPVLAPSTLEKGVWRLDPASATPEDRDYMYYKLPLSPSLLVNTQQVPPGQEPKSYQDLLNSKWKGKIIFMTPAIGGQGSGWFDATYRTLGLDYMKALAKQVNLSQKNTEPVEMVARGQYAVAISPNIPRALALIEEGAPIRFVHPKDGSHLSEGGFCLIRGAPNSNAAKLFLQWFYTKEGQTLSAPSLRAISVRKDVPQDYLPEGLRYVEGAPLLRSEIKEMRQPGRVKELRALAKQIFEEGK